MKTNIAVPVKDITGKFTKGKAYPCTMAYVFSGEPVADVICDSGEVVILSLNDNDFTFEFIGVGANLTN